MNGGKPLGEGSTGLGHYSSLGLNRPHVIVSIDKTTYAHWERPELTVRNIGLMPITFGQGYLITAGRTGAG